MNRNEFEYLASLDLGKKVARTVTQMMLFDKTDGGYISMSGGKGSTVLADINRRYDVNMPLVTASSCERRKKGPLTKWARDNGRLPITAEMATESINRRREYMKNGCIQDGKKCTPMGFWTEEDLDSYIEWHKLEISSLYDDPTCSRTGCPECGFGILNDPERYERINRVRPNTYKHFMGGGEWVRKEPHRYVKFRPGSIPIWSDLYWVPSKKGLGLQFVVNYITKSMEL